MTVLKRGRHHGKRAGSGEPRDGWGWWALQGEALRKGKSGRKGTAPTLSGAGHCLCSPRNAWGLGQRWLAAEAVLGQNTGPLVEGNLRAAVFRMKDL